MFTAWILMFQLTSGSVEVYRVYTDQAHCLAQAETIKHTVQGTVACVGINLR
jgi:hypothetical protein